MRAHCKIWHGVARTLRKIDRSLENPAYNFIIHTAPLQEGNMPQYHWHIEIMRS